MTTKQLQRAANKAQKELDKKQKELTAERARLQDLQIAQIHLEDALTSADPDGDTSHQEREYGKNAALIAGLTRKVEALQAELPELQRAVNLAEYNALLGQAVDAKEAERQAQRELAAFDKRVKPERNEIKARFQSARLAHLQYMEQASQTKHALPKDPDTAAQIQELFEKHAEHF